MTDPTLAAIERQLADVRPACEVPKRFSRRACGDSATHAVHRACTVHGDRQVLLICAGHHQVLATMQARDGDGFDASCGARIDYRIEEL